VFRWRGPRRRHETLKGALFHRRLAGRAPRVEEFVALDGVDLEISPGDSVAVIGPNGSGKSTLLKLASGILRPTAGTVEVDGRVTALIELGAGFHPEITGRENVVINGMLLGLSRPEIERKMDEIIAFADLGPFIDQPVKTYSSGMYVRLGFAVAVSVEPDILLIDEVLAVGDAAFTRRGLDRLARMRRRGVTMVLVSHDLDLVGHFADRAVYLRGGRVVADGVPDAVIARYRSDVAGGEAADGAEQRRVRVVEEGRRWGNGDVEIVEVAVSTAGSEQRLVPSGAPCTVHIRYRVHHGVDDFVFGIGWQRVDGAVVGGHNTDLDGLRPRRLEVDGEVRCHYDALELAPGDYQLDAAVHRADGLAYDYWCDAARVRVTSAVDWPGIWAPRHRWQGEGPEWE
jgi:ABC-type polysaccharide/polyol phosphate transport system ATPase subunit